jgi:hypothetical protein
MRMNCDKEHQVMSQTISEVIWHGGPTQADIRRFRSV